MSKPENDSFLTNQLKEAKRLNRERARRIKKLEECIREYCLLGVRLKYGVKS